MKFTIEDLTNEIAKLVQQTQTMTFFSTEGLRHVVRPIEREIIKNPLTKEIEIAEANYKNTGLAGVGTFKKTESFYDFKKKWIATKILNLLQRKKIISFDDFTIKETEQSLKS